MAEPIADTIKKARGFNLTDDDILDDLQSHPDYGEKVKSLRAKGAAAKDIVDVLSEGGAESPGYASMIGSGLAQGAMDATQAVGSGVAHTITGLSDIARKGGKAMGVNLPEVPAVLREAGETPPDAGVIFKGAKALEQMGEFMLPGGIVNDVSKAANFGGKLGAASEALARVAAEGTSAGLVRGAQTGGDLGEMGTAAALAAGITAPFASVNAALRMIKPSTLYAPSQFITKIPDRFRGQRLDEIVTQGMDNNITISVGGLKKAQQVEAQGQAARDAFINAHANDLVDLDVVRQPLLDFRVLAGKLGETNVVRQIDKRLMDLEKQHGYQPGVPPGTVTLPAVNPQATLHPSGMPRTINTPAIPSTPAKITVAQAQELKNFAQSLAAPMFERTSESVGTQKIRQLLSEGFMKGIEDVIPEVRGLNRNIQNTKILKQAIEDYINSNPSLVNMHTAFWAVVNPKVAVTSLALTNPRIRSALAVAAHTGVPQNAGAALGRVAAGTVPQLFSQPMPQGPGQ